MQSTNKAFSRVVIDSQLNVIAQAIFYALLTQVSSAHPTNNLTGNT
jgi:hypothetical protein